MDFARHLVLRVVDAGAARRVLGSLVDGSPGVPQITTAERWTHKPASFLNIAITADGLRALGEPVDGFPAASIRGAADPATAALVGDVGDSAPSRWVEGLADPARAHVLLSIWALGSIEPIEHVCSRLRPAFAGAFEQSASLDANALPDSKVHFGYSDNIAQPQVEGAPERKRPYPDAQPVSPAGAFLLGHPNQNGGAIYRVAPEPLSTNSSFAAFRMLEQDVAGFEAWLERASAEAGVDRELLAAKVCGRWRNGTPLVLSPDTDTPDPPLRPEQINDFDYVSADPERDDTFGFKCPVGSHIRRTNPRGAAIIAGGSLHRIIRRAMPYGPPFDPATPDDAPRGLIGYFINADLANQFELVMSQWVNRSDFVKSVRGPDGANPVKNISGQDVLLGVNDPATSSFTLPSPGSNRKLTGLGAFTATRGAAYCDLPSITALRYLAAGAGR